MRRTPILVALAAVALLVTAGVIAAAETAPRSVIVRQSPLPPPPLPGTDRERAEVERRLEYLGRDSGTAPSPVVS